MLVDKIFSKGCKGRLWFIFLVLKGELTDLELSLLSNLIVG